MSALPAITTLVAAILGGFLGLWIERQRQHYRQGELLVAIHAEIAAGLSRAAEQTTTKEAAYATENADPFGVPDETDFVFLSIKDNLSLLPREAIHSVVRYYKLAAQGNAMTRALADAHFQRQSPAEKAKYVGQLIELLEEQEAVAHVALDDIEGAIAMRREPGLHHYRPARRVAGSKSKA